MHAGPSRIDTVDLPVVPSLPPLRAPSRHGRDRQDRRRRPRHRRSQILLRHRQGADPRGARCPQRRHARHASARAPASSSATAGSILTIGYLIVEADEVEVVDQARPHAAGARRRLRPRDAASGWCAPIVPLEAHADCRSATRQARRARSRDDRQLTAATSMQRSPTSCRSAAVHRQLGVPARPGDLHRRRRSSTGAAPR